MNNRIRGPAAAGGFHEPESDHRFFLQVRLKSVDDSSQHYVAIRHQPGTGGCERSTGPTRGADLTHCAVAQGLSVFLLRTSCGLPAVTAKHLVASIAVILSHLPNVPIRQTTVDRWRPESFVCLLCSRHSFAAIRQAPSLTAPRLSVVPRLARWTCRTGFCSWTL